MKIIKNSKFLQLIILIALAIIALVISLWSMKNKGITTSGYNKSIETTDTQPSVNNALNYEGSAPAEGDRTFSSIVDEIYDEYPWYKHMPIDTNEYTIVWELDTTRFRVRLKMSSTSQQYFKDAVLSRALSNLKQVINEDLSNYQYYVVYID